MRPLNGRRSWLGAVAAAVLGCAGPGHYVWAETLAETPAEPTGEYKLAPGDLIFVRVFNQDPLSGRTRVRPDGRVTVPFVNE